MKTMQKTFTLIEVIIAMGILAGSIGLALTISTTTTTQMNYASRQWYRVHCLTQAAEYYLTCGPAGGAFDNEVFPYNDCRMDCQLVEPINPPETQYIDESADVPARTLMGLQIEVYFSKENRTEGITVDKLIYTGQDE